jgi:hypothetical protein
MRRSYPGSRTRRSAARLDASAPAGDLPGMEAIYLIVLFIAVIAVLNRIEFGRFD